jgi:glycosyltransferase involved in cell wall biosynthesis
MDSADRPIRLLLAIPHLGGGGAERVIALLAQHLNPARFEIHLALLAPDAPGTPTLPPHIYIHRLHCHRVRRAAIPLLRLIRNLQPRLILSGMAHWSFLILSLKPFLPRHTRILVRQNTTASASAQGWLTRLAYRRLYPRAHRVLCQSQAMANDLVEQFGLPPEKLVVLHNPIVSHAPITEPERPASSPNLLFVGRLSHEKGADLILHAFAELRNHYPAATLTLLGIGPEESALKSLAQSLQIASAIHFAGHTDPAGYYAAATLFVLPSRYEGLPNALLEAAAFGLPIVATPASGGIVDLLRNARGCWLTHEITASSLAQTLHQALTSLASSPQRFDHAFLAPFRIESAIPAYSNLLLAEARFTLAFLIPTVDQIGGAERQVLDLAQEFASRRWPVTLIVLSGSRDSSLPILHEAGIRYVSLGMRKAWIDPRGWLRYYHWHRSTHPEILHAHLPHATFFARLSRLLAPVPVLIDTIHTTAAGSNTRRLLYRLTHPLTNRITCVSRAVQDFARDARIASHSTLLPNGVRIPSLETTSTYTAGAFYSASERFDSADLPPFRWLATGRLSLVKNYPTLLQAFAELPASTKLTIAGAGPEEPQLRALAAALGIAPRVHFAGFQCDIQPLLGNADAFVQSSLWEGLPLAILEASAASLPVVATDAPGTRETILPGHTGWLVPIANAAALASAMRDLMAMPLAERHQMGMHGRAFVEANFALPVIVDRWEQLYRQLSEEANPILRFEPQSTAISNPNI